MGLFDRFGGTKFTELAETAGPPIDPRTVVMLTERLAELELALEDVNWIKLSLESEHDFSRDGLQRIVNLSRLFFLKNPVINRGVSTQVLYVWGQGISIQARHPAVDGVVQRFLDDKQNKAELTSHQARTMKEQDLQTTGNLFFTLFTHLTTGRVRVSSVPFDEIKEIVTDPDNRRKPWYYKREYTATSLDASTGISSPQSGQVAYYPDWEYNPPTRPKTIGSSPVKWESPIYHVKVGGLSDMLFGVPETYSALDWARAYKEFLEDWATIIRAYSKFAFKATTPGGKAGIQSMRTKLNTTISINTGMGETNPPPLAGSTFVAGVNGADLQPIRTAGATTSADDGRRMLLMACMAFGLPETFFSDVSVGTLATAKSLDRPTELKFLDRQTFWKDLLHNMLQYAIDKAATAPRYPGLKGTKAPNEEGDEQVVTLAVDPDTDQPIDRHIDLDFPSILEHDKAADVTAIVTAATLDGKALAGTMDPKLVSRLLLSALGQDDIDDLLDKIFPEPDEGEGALATAEQNFVTQVAEMREALRALAKLTM